MLISDWSSDVCSSDLHRLAIGPTDALAVTPPRRREEHVGDLRDGRVRLTVDIMPRGQRPQHTVVRVPEHLQHVAQGANRRERRRALQRLPERLDLIRPGIELAPGPAEQVLEDRAEQNLERLRVKRSEEHTSELQSLMRISYAVFFLK